MILDESDEDDSGLSAIEEDSGSERDLETAPNIQSKQKASSTPLARHTMWYAKKTSACVSTSASTPIPDWFKSKPFKEGLDFKSLVRAEQATWQYKLELAKEKVYYDLQKIHTKVDIKM